MKNSFWNLLTFSNFEYVSEFFLLPKLFCVKLYPPKVVGSILLLTSDFLQPSVCLVCVKVQLQYKDFHTASFGVFSKLIKCLEIICGTLIHQILVVCKKYFHKGLLISKCLFGVFNSPKKRTKHREMTINLEGKPFPFKFYY